MRPKLRLTCIELAELIYRLAIGAAACRRQRMALASCLGRWLSSGIRTPQRGPLAALLARGLVAGALAARRIRPTGVGASALQAAGKVAARHARRIINNCAEIVSSGFGPIDRKLESLISYLEWLEEGELGARDAYSFAWPVARRRSPRALATAAGPAAAGQLSRRWWPVAPSRTSSRRAAGAQP